MRAGRRLAGLGVALLVVSALTGCDWSMFRFGSGHTGNNPSETALDVRNAYMMTSKWTSPTGGGVDSSPAVADGTVFLGSSDHKVYALNVTTGAVDWTTTTGAAVSSSPAIANGTVYVGSDDHKVYALDATTGAVDWTTTTGAAVSSSPAIANGTVYVGSDGLHALNAATGAPVWQTPPSGIRTSPAVANGIVYVSYNGVVALDAMTGGVLFVASGGATLSSPAVVNGTVYLGSSDHNVHAYGLGPDSDGDGLVDAVETNTGGFVDRSHTGTDPHRADTDGDGISDGDEVLGTKAGLNLPAMGTDPDKKDVLIETDWFDDNAEPDACGAHSHRPTAAAIAKVAAAFAAAPVTNPNGTTGVHFIADYGQGGAFTRGNLVPDADGVIAGGVNGTDYTAAKAANFASNRKGYLHYVLMPHRYDTSSASSGQAEINGDDLVVSLYCFGSDQNVANTIMHELGHNLGLRHGGNVDTNYKPNYNSVMNYRFQFPGVDTNCDGSGDGVLDYSHGLRASLNENALNESLGICLSVALDWNGNAVIDQGTVATDINLDGLLQVLTDRNDWTALQYAGIHDTNGGASLSAPEIVDEQPVPPSAQHR